MGEGRILVQATVTAIGDEHFLYPCCTQCYSKLLHDVHHARWRCLKCGVSCLSDELEWRYRLRLTIADTQEYRQIAVFGKTVQPFFGASANTFQRFLNHLQKTESDLADIVLKQAVDCVFVGHSFLFGFASATKQKPVMTVSCLSNVKDTKGYNSDLIAVQMICPDQNQMITVSKQMSLMFKEILSNSFHQLSTVDDSKEESFSKSRSWNRKSSNGSVRSYFNSILELSENCSMNSIASLLLSCENSFLKNISVSPGSLSSNCEEIEQEQDRFEEQKVKQQTYGEQDMTIQFNGGDTQSEGFEKNDETRFDFENKTESEDTRYKEATSFQPYDEFVFSEDVSVFPQEFQPEYSFHDTMNDSSLLLADKDDYLQLLVERTDAVAGRTSRSSPSSRTSSNDSDDSEVIVGFDHRKKNMTKSKENQRSCESQTYVMVESVMDDETKDCSKLDEDNNEWEEMPFSEDLEEFLANAYHVSHCNVTEPLHESIEQPRTSDANSTLAVMRNIPSMIMCQEDKHEETNNATLNCSEISVQQKNKDASVSHISHVTAVTLIDMPESENLDEFLQMAACPQINSEELFDQDDLVTLSGPHVSFSNISRTDHTGATVTTNSICYEQTIDHAERAVTGIKPVQSPMGNCVIVQDTEPIEDSLQLQEDLDIYFANSFSPDGYQCPSTNLLHQETPSDQQQTEQLTNCDASIHCKEDQSVCDKNTPVEDNQLTYVTARAPFKNDNEMTGDPEVVLNQIGKCGVSYKNEAVSSPRAPGYLFHPVASIGSLNYSKDIFDDSGDLFDSSQMEGEEQPSDCNSFEPKDSCMKDSVLSKSLHQSAVCESVDESHEDCPGTENIPESNRKQVKFARRLSHVSTLQLIDIRMKLNFGNRSEANSTPVKSCIRNRPDVPRRALLVEDCGMAKPLFLNKPLFGPEVVSDRTATCDELPVRRNILVEDSEPISDVSIDKSSLEESIVQNNDYSKDADLCLFSQDLFACSQPMDSNLSSNDMEDVFGNTHEPFYKTEVRNQEVNTNPNRCLSEHDVTGTQISTAQGFHLQDRNSSYRTNSPTLKTLPHCIVNPTSAHKTLSSVTYSSPFDGSPLLFSQLDPSALESQVTSTPAGDSDQAELMLTLTPDLFSP